MKFAALIFPVLLFIGPCDTDESTSANDTIYEACIQVKTVASICGEAVLEIQQEKYKSLGEDWNGFYNVFFTVLPCGEEGYGTIGSMFTIRLLEKPAQGECIKCYATVGYSGTRKYSIAVAEGCQ